MRTEIALITLLTLAGTALFFYQENQTVNFEANTNVAMKAYVQWKAAYGLNTNGQEDQYRFTIFNQNFEFVQNHNANTLTDVQLQMTEFAALTNEEYRQTKLSNYIKSENIPQAEVVSVERLPNSVNWVTAGAVTPVVNQGGCGSCWAFSTVAGLEGLNQIKTGNLIPLSQQQVTSCVPAPFSFGCGGGNLIFGYSYTALKGIESGSDYPYVNGSTDTTAPCNYDKSKVIFQNKGYGQVPANSPSAMQQALNTQVLSVAIDAGSIFFQLYKQGVLSSANCGTQLNHAVTLVAYDTAATQPNWTIKNSWGASWGNKGYVQFAIVEGDGICGVNMDVSFPTY